MGQNQQKENIVLRIGITAIGICSVPLLPWYFLVIYIIAYALFFDRSYEFFFLAIFFDALYLFPADINIPLMTLWAISSVFVAKYIRPRVAFFTNL